MCLHREMPSVPSFLLRDREGLISQGRLRRGSHGLSCWWSLQSSTCWWPCFFLQSSRHAKPLVAHSAKTISTRLEYRFTTTTTPLQGFHPLQCLVARVRLLGESPRTTNHMAGLRRYFHNWNRPVLSINVSIDSDVASGVDCGKRSYRPDAGYEGRWTDCGRVLILFSNDQKRNCRSAVKLILPDNSVPLTPLTRKSMCTLLLAVLSAGCGLQRST